MKSIGLALVVVLVACGSPPPTTTPTALAAQHRAGDGSVRLRFVPQLAAVGARAAMRITPDGTKALIADATGALSLFDVSTGTLLRTLRGHTARVTALAISDDGARAFSGGDDKTFNVWNLNAGTLERTLAPQSSRDTAGDDDKPVDTTRGAPTAIAISPDGKWALSTSDSDEQRSEARYTRDIGRASKRTINLWDLEAGKLLRPLHVNGSIFAFSPDSLHAFVVVEAINEGGDALALVDVPSGNVVHVLPSQPRTSKSGRPTQALRSSSIAISPDASRALFIDETGASSLLDTASGISLAKPANERIAEPAFSRDGKTILFSTATNVVAWNVESQAASHEWPNAFATTLGLAFVSGGGPFVVASIASAENIEFRDLEHNTRVRSSLARPISLRSASMSSDGRRAATTDGSTIQIWDLDSLSLRRKITSPPADGANQRFALDVQISPDGKTVLSRRDQVGSLKLSSTETGAVLRDYGDHVGITRFATDGSIVSFGDAGFETRSPANAAVQKRALVVQAPALPEKKRGGAGHEQQQRFEYEFSDDVGMGVKTYWDISASGNKALAQEGDFQVLDARTGSVTCSLRTQRTDERKRTVSSGSLSPDGTRVLLGDGILDPAHVYPLDLRLFDATSGQLLFTLGKHARSITSVAFSADGSRGLAADSAGTIELWDLKQGTLITSHPGAGASVSRLMFFPDGKRVAFTTSDGTLRIWNVAADASVTLLAAAGEWIAFDDDGYFDASRHGGDLVRAIEGTHAYRIDQLALRNNRPDLLLTRLGLGSPTIVDHFRTRHERRLKNLGLTDAALSASFEGAPVVRITDKKQTAKFVDLTFDIESRGGASLASYNVFANEVPLFGATGKPLSGTKAHVTERVELTSGANQIEVTARDGAGAESLRDGWATDFADAAGKAAGDLYFLGFGVSKYRDTRLNLDYAHKDAGDLGDLFKTSAAVKSAFKNVHVAVHINQEVTRDGIVKAKDFLKSAKVDDTVVLFVAGHGTHTRDAAADYYFVTHDVDVKHLRETAAPFSLVEDLLQDIAARRKLFLMDTCESGEKDDDNNVNTTSATTTSSTGARQLHARSIRSLVLDEVGSGASAPLPSTVFFDRERYIYNDLARRTGAIVFSSSRGNEVSFERDDLQNGVFTSVLKSALNGAADTNRDGTISMSELRDWVTADVAERTNARQNPTVDRDNLSIQIGFPTQGNGPPSNSTRSTK